MNPALRILEEWTTHQDYLWFLAVLAWGGVVGAELRFKENAEGAPPRRWLVALALAQMGGALAELVLLAQDLFVPYTKLDLAMGAAQAAGTAALGWSATTGARFPKAARAGLLLLLAALTVGRLGWPLEAGVLLCLIQATVVLAMLRQEARPLSLPAGIGLIVAPLVATHGPLAYALGQGRRETDWSHFALMAAGATAAVGAVLAAGAWRQRLRQAMPDGAIENSLRRDLRRAVMVLALWLGMGVLLAVWSGRIARRAYEENLLRRVEMAALALDEGKLTEALGPDLRIESIARRRYPDGRPVDVATAPNTRAPVYAEIRSQLARIHARNPDFNFFYIATARQGQLLLLRATPRGADTATHVIHHELTPMDLARVAAGKSFLEGPLISEGWRPQFSAKAVIKHPDTGQVLGWLVADVEATRWMTTFTQARLQTMALVGVGVALWAMAVAYRLRREARDAAVHKAAAADAADRMKSAFLAKVSHELRTPIQSILGYGELLENVPLSDLHRGWLTALRSHGDIMLRLVNDLIDLGALQSGAFQLQSGPVDLRALISGCAAALRPAASAKGLAFRSEIAPGAPAWVSTDAVRLRQILLNLLNNAVKFTTSGSVVLTVAVAEDAHVEFVIADTGPGIPVALRSRLFQPFARLDPAAGGGSGLGLALVQGLCTVMGGTVRLADNTAKGATFMVRLPLSRCDEPGEGPRPARSAKSSLAGVRVLVAEDNTLVREMLMAFLDESGAEAIFAPDGVTALALAREFAPDVLLLDIALPGLDGIAVAEALRRDGPRPLRIIGLSAHVSSQDEARARRAGMDTFLPKPVRLASLAAAITEQVREPPAAPVEHRIGDERLRQRLIAQFSQETPRVMAEMRAALGADDWSQVQRSAHYLKNSADVLGMAALQDACQRCARWPRRPDALEMRLLIEEIESAIPTECLVLAGVKPPASD